MQDALIPASEVRQLLRQAQQAHHEAKLLLKTHLKPALNRLQQARSQFMLVKTAFMYNGQDTSRIDQALEDIDLLFFLLTPAA